MLLEVTVTVKNFEIRMLFAAAPTVENVQTALRDVLEPAPVIRDELVERVGMLKESFPDPLQSGMTAIFTDDDQPVGQIGVETRRLFGGYVKVTGE